MRNIGFLYNCSLNTNPRIRLSPSLLNRVALIDADLREWDSRLLFFSPKQVRADTSTVLGYHFENGRFLPRQAELPRVNGNWTYETRRLLDKGMGYQAFNRWAEARGIGIYVPLAFSELVGNKYDTYNVIRSFHESIHPYCEPYRYSARQLDYFIEHGTLTFIKPRAGNKGDRIVTLRRNKAGLRLTYYKAGRRRRFVCKHVVEAEELLREILPEGRGYIIQHGVDALRHEGSVFDIRVVMVNDGSAWHWLHEARLSPPASDVSNVSQGGRSVATERLLFDLLGPESADAVLQRIRSEAYLLAGHLERLHPGEMMELAFDFVVDQSLTPRLLEINTKPGLVSVGFERTIYDKQADDEAAFETSVYPHARALARFLRTKSDLAHGADA